MQINQTHYVLFKCFVSGQKSESLVPASPNNNKIYRKSYEQDMYKKKETRFLGNQTWQHIQLRPTTPLMEKLCLNNYVVLSQTFDRQKQLTKHYSN